MHCFAAFYVVIILSCGRFVNQKNFNVMRQETFAILFLMRKGRPKKNGLAPIFARITTGGLRQEVYTQCDSNPETWNQHKERAMGTNKLAIQVNERLNDFRVKIIDIRSKLLAEAMRPMPRRSNSAT